MDKDTLINILASLIRTAGVSGDEQETASVAAGYLKPYITRLDRDKLGNLIAYKEGSGGAEAPSLLIAAHIDEIGAMVTNIEQGFVRFSAIGGLDPRILPGQAVEIHGRRRIKGVIGASPPHLHTAQEVKREAQIKEMFIDLGLNQEQACRQVRIGDYISFDQGLQVMDSGEFLFGKAMDNRSGVAAMICCAAELSEVHHFGGVYFVATVQEEVGVRGAVTAAFGLEPDLAVAVDVTHGLAPGLGEEEGFELGGGPVVGLGPNFHPLLVERLKALAGARSLSYQLEPVSGPASTDSRALQISREGIPCALLSIPLRYMHSTVETLHLDDVYHTGQLLAYFARSIDYALMEDLKCI